MPRGARHAAVAQHVEVIVLQVIEHGGVEPKLIREFAKLVEINLIVGRVMWWLAIAVFTRSVIQTHHSKARFTQAPTLTHLPRPVFIDLGEKILELVVAHLARGQVTLRVETDDCVVDLVVAEAAATVIVGGLEHLSKGLHISTARHEGGLLLRNMHALLEVLADPFKVAHPARRQMRVLEKDPSAFHDGLNGGE